MGGRNAAKFKAMNKLGVGIATRGRAHSLAACLDNLGRQLRAPDRILICGTDPSDVAGISESPGLTLIQAAPGLTQQRNKLLATAADLDILVFFDDDFLPAPAYLQAIETCMADNPDLAGAGGSLIADDTRGPGLSVQDGLARIAADASPMHGGWRPAAHLYGCNMALRLSVVRAHDLWFDERLPLYAWSEDIDFSHRLARHGALATVPGARGVHLGVKSGRSPGRRLGYSQVANPVYLFRKGSYSLRRAGGSVGRNLAMNVARAAWPEPYVDRRGRLAGNLLALRDWYAGRMAPERVLEL